MANCGTLFKCALVAIVLVSVIESGATDEKLASCCKVVSNQEITEPILGYLFQKPSPPCVRAMIFQTASGLFCADIRAPWVLRKVKEFRQSQTTTVPPSTSSSLLAIITSTAPLPSSSASLPSSSAPLPSSSSAPLPSASTSQEDSE